MAEGALFSLATNLLSTLGSIESRKVRIAKGDIEKLRMSVERIRLVLLDAEKQQESSAAVKGWVGLVRNALYDAEDLFDEMITICEVRQQAEGSKIQNQVRGLFSPGNLLAYLCRVSGRVKALSRSLDLASKEIRLFCFVQSQQEEQMPVVAREGSFVGSKGVIGRDAEVEEIRDLLLQESWNEEKRVPVIAVVGIGGMGKTTLARLVYGDVLVEQKFEKKWWASVSDTDEDTEILRKICKAMTYGSTPRELDQLTNCIGESVREAGKFLLVIDGAWDEDHVRWSKRLSLLHNGCVGCRIIVTTRSPLVARAMEAVKTQKLSGLSEEDSWQLFKTIAFTPEKEDDPGWTILGRGIVNKCLGVPLAITRIAGHLYGRSMEEWEYFRNEELSKIELSDNVVMSVLKLSYDRLPSGLKHCFAYCALFPRDFVISKQKLLCLWIAQGYVPSEEIGDAYLKQLLSISFLEKAEQDEDTTEIEHYKMHDLVHDLARHVAGDDVAVLTDHSNHRNRSARHASVGFDKFQSSETLPELPNVDRLRSCLFTGAGSPGLQVIRQRLVKLQCLRALDLSRTGIEDVPRSIGGLEHLRYLNLSRNHFNSLPDSISKLFNLVTLDISGCDKLKAWPKNTRRLINLRYLEYSHCPGLKQMPDGFGELTYLQHLSDFKPGGNRSLLEAFSKLTLKGKLTIDFANCHVNDEDDDDDCWRVPATVETLRIRSYLGACLPRWRDERPAAIVRLELHCCENLRRLPDLGVLRSLKTLVVKGAKVLEYVEGETTSSSPSSSSPFPCLEELSLVQLPELKGWSRAAKLEGRTTPRLKKLEIAECPGMELWGNGNGNTGVEWDSLTSLRTLKIWPMPTPETLPRCLLKRSVQILEYFFPQELAIEENNQASDDDSIKCLIDFKPCGRDSSCLSIRGAPSEEAKTIRP